MSGHISLDSTEANIAASVPALTVGLRHEESGEGGFGISWLF